MPCARRGKRTRVMADVSQQMKSRRTSPYLMGLIAGSVVVAVYDAFTYLGNIEPIRSVASVWPFAFLVLLALWIVEDSQAYPSVYKPFEYGFLVFLYWLPYLPYYLWRTRGALGLVMLGGIVVLYSL